MSLVATFFSPQFARFIVVGGTAAALHWLARFALSLWLPFAWAVAIAYLIGMTVAFALNSFYVFPESTKPWPVQARDFAMINVAFFPIVWLITLQLDRILIGYGMGAYSEGLAHALAIPVPMVVTFLLYKFFAFKESGHG